MDTKLQFATGLDGEIESVAAGLEPMVGPIVFVKKADPRLEDPAFLQRLEGAYTLHGEDLQVRLRGRVLTLQAKGQPAFDLLPLRGTRFALKGLPGFAAQFTLPPEGPASQVELDQPDGIFSARRN
jgi:hypothetical protein